MKFEKLNLIKYMGGKNFMLNEILSLLDYSKTCYIELFGGSGKVLLNKKTHKVEIYNDIDKQLYNLFKVIRDNYDEFMNKIDNYLYCEETFKELKNSIPKNNIDMAVKTFYLFNLGFAGESKSFGYSIKRKLAQAYFNKVSALQKIKERLKNVIILNRDYKIILRKLKNETDIMLYADPPYYGAEYYYKNGNFGKQDHETLAKYLNEAKYNFMLSYYYFDGIEDLYPKHKFNYYEFKKTKASYGITKQSKSKTRPVSIELLITNYKIDNLMEAQ